MDRWQVAVILLTATLGVALIAGIHQTWGAPTVNVLFDSSGPIQKPSIERERREVEQVAKEAFAKGPVREGPVIPPILTDTRVNLQARAALKQATFGAAAIILALMSLRSFLGLFLGGDRSRDVIAKALGTGGIANQVATNTNDPATGTLSPGAIWYNLSVGDLRWWDGINNVIRSAKAFKTRYQIGVISKTSGPNVLPNGGADFGPDTIGAGLSVYTPAATPTISGGWNECADFLASLGGGVFELAGPITAAAQFLSRNGVTGYGNNYLVKSTLSAASCPSPFISDPDNAMTAKTDFWGMNFSGGSITRVDTSLLAYGSAGTTFSYTNATAFCQIVAIVSDNGSVSGITVGGNALTTNTAGNYYGTIAVAPGKTVVVTYSTSPQVTLLGSTMIFGPSQANNFDVQIQNSLNGNGMTLTGWANSLGVDQGNHAFNHWHTLYVQGVGPYGMRCMGSGGSNNDAAVNNTFGAVWIGSYGTGGVLGYGVAFSVHTDSNHVLMLYTVSATAAAAASSAVVFNDATFNSAATGVRVNQNTIQKCLAQQNATTNLATQLTVLTNAAGIQGANTVKDIFASASQTTIISITNGGILNANVQAPNIAAPYWVNSVNNIIGCTAPLVLVNQSISGIANTTAVAAGFTLGPFIASSTGRVWIYAYGTAQTAVGAAKVTVALYRNTSTSTGGSAWAGATAMGSNKVVQGAGAGLGVGFSCGGFFQLVKGTTYYFDLQLFTSNATDTAALNGTEIGVGEWPA